MGTRFSIEAIYKAIDQITAPIRKMTIQNKNFTRAIKNDFAAAQRSVKSFGQSVKQNLGNAFKIGIAIGIGALAIGFGAAAKEFVTFSQSITEANARFKDVTIGTESAKKTMEELKKSAREAGATTQFTATESAKALDFFARAGFTSTEAMAILKNQIDLATVTGEDFARAADISSDLLGAMGLAAEDSATKIMNLKNLNNSLGLASNMANVTLEDMFETLKSAGPVGTAAGATMNELIAITAALGNSGIKGSMGATALKNAYIRLAAPTKNVNDALSDIGLTSKDFVDQSGKMRSMVDIMKLLGDKTKDLGQAEQLRVFAEIFGKQAVAGALNMSKSLADINNIFNELEGDKKIKDIADEIRTGLLLRIKILKSSLFELGFKFIEAFEKNGGAALDFITKAIQKFDPGPIIKGMKTAIKIFVTFFKVIKPLIPFILGIIIAWQLYQKVLLIAAVAQAVFNLIMSLNPIGLIIIAIGLLIGLIILVVLNWDKIKEVILKTVQIAIEWIKKMGDTIKTSIMEGVQIAIEWINMMGEKIVDLWDKFQGLALIIAGPFVIIVEVLRSIIEHWAEIKNGFSEGGILGGILAIGKAIIAGMLDPLQSLLELVSKVPGVGDLAKGGAEQLAKLREGLFESTDPTVAPMNPSERSSFLREEQRQTAELTIKDQTGNAQLKKSGDASGIRLKLQQSGGF